MAFVLVGSATALTHVRADVGMGPHVVHQHTVIGTYTATHLADGTVSSLPVVDLPVLMIPRHGSVRFATFVTDMLVLLAVLSQNVFL